MQSKAVLFGFVAAASAQTTDSSTESMTEMASTLVTASPVVTADDASSTAPAVAVVNGTLIDAGAANATASSSSSSWTWFNTTVTATVVVAELTTVCGAATTLTFNGVEFPATEGETITITNCPCTVTTTTPTLTSTICPGSTGAVAPTGPVAPPPPPPANNAAPGGDEGEAATTPAGAASASTYAMPSAPTSGMVEVSGASSSSFSMGVLGKAVVVGFVGLLVL
ncbi:hypothetical protein G7054_g9989 [Neopestalotiopsis clavispora]|nr:hypothetical protein G7054_g9989 [Neopestalotiopsis clavispora]